MNQESPILHYGNCISSVPYALLQKVSIQEQARIIPFTRYKNVNISLLDLSTNSTTGTFKDWLACVTIADCLQKGVKRIVFQSSGNTGNALTEYAARQGIQTVLFYPKTSRYKIEPRFVNHETSMVVECDLPEPQIKNVALQFSKRYEIDLFPTLDHQLEANKLRAYVLADHYRKTGEWFDWHVQSISSGYGVFGMYKGFEELKQTIDRQPPRLLGIQQEVVAPYVEYMEKLKQPPSAVSPSHVPLIEPTLFRSAPTDDLLRRMQEILDEYDGTMMRLTNEDYLRREQEMMTLLGEKGINVGYCNTGTAKHLIEKAGILALVGCYQAIENGTIPEGASVLVAFTGGTRSATTEYVPTRILASTENLPPFLDDLAQELNIPKRKNEADALSKKPYG